ncbi:para-aminobenzoate synthase, component I [Sulfurimonas gotlandica GD1]|jgi:para-aminobenzoate synthetase component 1|uniref:Para-aminobenzoate synthase, component I n=1 Tax=Sulfurimonas gotlandica (strain DSM 19862 / JCM 16533 / GD1) TaxID=929558 RepID=B6BMD8_SULGG|nr:aminodeoxychorismate synthase component I [Sulfurimonas gotlandica]EDZ61895.1 anthranilate synthase component I and chorismate binding protein [Sulfurimonas gotlandica GD1]EHP29284.1 para-aminobenzoate synthase, component I [Sulfurimonas gotlandica GD1]
MTFKHLNALGKKRKPFLFISDFLAQNIEVILLDELSSQDIEFCIDENYIQKKHGHSFKKEAVGFESYKKKFDEIIEHIKSGDTYLLNLTAPTKIYSDLTLKEIYNYANAPYKLRYKNEFVCFSPEKFVQIKDSTMHTFPMKGTIDASITDAKNKILHDEKEMAEHTMVVDLLRNDLSIVASDVKVEEFRYVKKIDSGEKELLQVSSHISGNVGEDWHERIGDILNSLLPAGSISGTPKKSTLEIIKNVESYERGFFSGVFGVYDGENFDSGVMIRFVEKTKDGYVYKSGGGITLDSDSYLEYNELLDKVYLP